MTGSQTNSSSVSVREEQKAKGKRKRKGNDQTPAAKQQKVAKKKNLKKPKNAPTAKEQKVAKKKKKAKNAPTAKEAKKKKKAKNAPLTVPERMEQLEKLLAWNPSTSVRTRAKLGIQRVQPVLRNTLTQIEMHKGGVRAGFDTTDPDELQLDDEVLLASTEALRSRTQKEVQDFQGVVACLRPQALEAGVNKVPEVRIATPTPFVFDNRHCIIPPGMVRGEEVEANRGGSYPAGKDEEEADTNPGYASRTLTRHDAYKIRHGCRGEEETGKSKSPSKARSGGQGTQERVGWEGEGQEKEGGC